MSLFDIEVRTITGEMHTMARYKGNVMLIVNTATGCGFAPQLKELQRLYDTYAERGFVVLGFPCSQFRNQEPGSDEEIALACELNFGVTFPLFSKINVNGGDAHPLFKRLASKARGVLGTKLIKWNFTKFLVDRNGKIAMRFAPTDEPIRMEERIRKLL